MNENRMIEHDWSERAFLCWTHLVADDISLKLLVSLQCFPGDLVVKNLPADAGEVGSIPGSGRSPGGGNGNPLQ